MPLYLADGLDASALDAADRFVREAAPDASSQATALTSVVRLLPLSDTAKLAVAERFIGRLDRLPDTAILAKINAHALLSARYGDLDMIEQVQSHARTIVALGRRYVVPQPPVAGASSPGGRAILDAYAHLAEAMADAGHADSALLELGGGGEAIIRRSRRRRSQRRIVSDRDLYQLVGQRAMPLVADRWINGAHGDVTTVRPVG